MLKRLLACAALLAASCDSSVTGPTSPAGDAVAVPGVLVSALSVPDDITCIRITTNHDGVATDHWFPTLVRPTPDLFLGLPGGAITFGGETYQDPCPEAEGDPIPIGPRHVASPVTAVHHPTATTRVGLVFRALAPTIVGTVFMPEIIDVDSDGLGTVALDADGVVWAWGRQTGGLPIPLLYFSGAVRVETAAHHVCALDAFGSLSCIFLAPDDDLRPVNGYYSVAGQHVADEVIDFSVGPHRVLYMTSDRVLTGFGTTTTVDVEPVSGLNQVASVADGHCWRNTATEVLCRATKTALDVSPSNEPTTLLAGGPSVVEMVMNTGDARVNGCFRDPQDAWRCFGPPFSPFNGGTPIAALKNTVSVATSSSSMCGVRNGLVRCYAAPDVGFTGAAGNGTFGGTGGVASTAPFSVVALPEEATYVTGGRHTYCAILVDGSLWCWGNNANGAIGDGTFENRYVPVRVAL